MDPLFESHQSMYISRGRVEEEPWFSAAAMTNWCSDEIGRTCMGGNMWPVGEPHQHDPCKTLIYSYCCKTIIYACISRFLSFHRRLICVWALMTLEQSNIICLGHKLGEHLVRSLVWYIKREDIMLQQKIRLEILLNIHGSVETEESYMSPLCLDPTCYGCICLDCVIFYS